MSFGSSDAKDPIGLETLKLFTKAERFNRWMFESISSYCIGSILEIGSGIGNISKLLLEKDGPLTLSDLRPEYCVFLKQRFRANQLNGIFQLDLSVTDFEENYPQLLGQFDTIVALNVIEHIEDDGIAVKNCKRLLKQGGRLIVLVPAFQVLNNSLDTELGHFRRYTKKSLTALLQKEDMNVTHTKYFNGTGIFGWWWAGAVLKSKIISTRQLKIYNKLVPVFRLIDKFAGNIAGLSVIAVAGKADSKV